MAQRDEQSVHEQAIARVAAMTAAGQQKPERSDDEHDRFAILSRAADEEAGEGAWS